MDRESSFWRGKRVLVTGHTGFKGSWLSLWLTRQGAMVSGYALPPPTTPSLHDSAHIGDLVDETIGDIRDEAALSACMTRGQPEIIFHLAAQSLVRRSYADPVTTYETNVMGTVKVLEAARHTPSVRVIVNVTSDKCYANREVIWGYRETDPMGGHDPYSSSKGCAELVAAAYSRSFFHAPDSARLASVRAGNVIGGGDWAEDRLVPDCFRALMSRASIPVRNPSAVRPWQHVLEPLSGYLLFAERLWQRTPGLPPALNFGPSDADVRPVGEIVEGILRRWPGSGDPAQWRYQPSEPLHEATLLTLDSTLARHTLGWKPRLSLDDALDLTTDWYCRFQNGEPMQDVTIRQIMAYEARGAETLLTNVSAQ